MAPVTRVITALQCIYEKKQIAQIPIKNFQKTVIIDIYLLTLGLCKLDFKIRPLFLFYRFSCINFENSYDTIVGCKIFGFLHKMM